jgi:hypothetical protein
MIKPIVSSMFPVAATICPIFSMEYIAFWKGLTRRPMLTTATIKEMSKAFRLLDALQLTYDIVVNKFDLVSFGGLEQLKQKTDRELQQAKLHGVKHVWYVSARNPQQFPYNWLPMGDTLTTPPPDYHPSDVDDGECFQHVVYE